MSKSKRDVSVRPPIASMTPLGTGVSPLLGPSTPPVELGYTRNLLCPDYATPYPGVAVDCPAAEGQASQPPLCTIDLEGTSEPCQPPTSSCRTPTSADLDREIKNAVLVFLAFDQSEVAMPLLQASAWSVYQVRYLVCNPSSFQ